MSFMPHPIGGNSPLTPTSGWDVHVSEGESRIAESLVSAKWAVRESPETG